MKTEMHPLRTRRAGSFALVLLAYAAVAPAQESSATSSGRAEPAVLEEVTVTARKREEKLIDVPFSVQVVSDEELSRLGAVNFSDYARTIAGVQIEDKGAGRGIIFMRGVSTGGDVDTGKESSVGVYFDEMPFSESSSQPDLKLYDIERIEVLRGPQGTLFGSGSLSGTLRVLPKQPKLEGLEGSAEGQVSSTEHGGFNYAVNAAVNLPLADRFALRVVGYHIDNEGFLTNGFTGEKRINDERTSGGRVALLFKPSENLDATLTGIYQDGDFGTYYQTTDHFPDLTIDEAEPEPFSDRYKMTSLKVNYAFGAAKLTSVSSYFDRRRYFENDVDFFTAFFGVPRAFSPLTYTAKAFTQELRLASQGEGRVSWVLGTYFSDRREFALQTISPVGEPVPPPADQLAYINRHTNVRQYAAFGEASYQFTPQWSFTAGVRASLIDSDNTSVNDGLLFGGSSFKTANGRDTPVTPRFILSYKPTETTQLYAQAAQGFRIGGSNPGLPPCQPELGCEVNVKSTFDPDTVWNYELGAKLQTPGGRLSLDADVFYLDWSKIQVNVGRGDGFNGFMNAGSARTKGIELAANARVTDHWRFGGQLTYTKGKLTSLADGVEETGVATVGNPLPMIPKITASVFAEWGFALAGDGWAYVRGDMQHVDDRDGNFVASNPRVLGSYDLGNLRIGVDRGQYNGSVFVSNITDERANLSDTTYSGLYQGQPYTWLRRNVNIPRTFGLVVSRRF